MLDAHRYDPSASGYNPTLINSTNDNHVAGAAYFNLFGTFDLTQSGPNVQLFAAINNLFDKEPPLRPNSSTRPNPTYFDQIGRSCQASASGVRVRF